MAVLYPKLVNAYTKFEQNCVYYKRNFSVLPRKHSTLLAKNAWNVYSPYGHDSLAIYYNTLSNQLGYTKKSIITIL